MGGARVELMFLLVLQRDNRSMDCPLGRRSQDERLFVHYNIIIPRSAASTDVQLRVYIFHTRTRANMARLLIDCEDRRNR